MRACGSMRQWGPEVLECMRRKDHRGKHKCWWREGSGSRWVDVIVRWRNRK